MKKGAGSVVSTGPRPRRSEMTIRFNTWVDADSMEEAWDNLWLKLKGGDLGDRVEKIFTATILENPEEDKETISPCLKIRERIDEVIEVIDSLGIEDSTASYWAGYKKALIHIREFINKEGDTEDED